MRDNKSCPFCGSADLTFAKGKNMGERKTIYALTCNNCEARGPQALSVGEAKEAWDNRWSVNTAAFSETGEKE